PDEPAGAAAGGGAGGPVRGAGAAGRGRGGEPPAGGPCRGQPRAVRLPRPPVDRPGPRPPRRPHPRPGPPPPPPPRPPPPPPSHPLQTKLVWVEPGTEVKARWLTGVTSPCDLVQEAIAKSMKSGQPVRLDDLDLPPEYCLGQPVAIGGRVRSVAVFPLLARGR